MLVLGVVAACANAAPPLPPRVEAAASRDDYLDRVERAAQAARRATRLAADEDAHFAVDRELATIAALLPPRERIVFDGRRLSVDNRKLLDLVESARALSQGSRRRRLAQQLQDRLLAMERGVSRRPAIGGNRRILGMALADAGSGRPGLIAELSERIATWLKKTLGDSLSLSPRVDGGRVPQPPQWLWIAAALLIISVTSVLMLRLTVRRTRIAGVAIDTVDFESANDRPRADAYGEAMAQARRGNHNEAVRLLFRSLQYRLDELRLVRYRRAQTDFEYLDSVRASAGILEPSVRSMIGTFERTTYGLRDCEPAEYERYTEKYRSVMDEAQGMGGR